MIKEGCAELAAMITTGFGTSIYDRLRLRAVEMKRSEDKQHPVFNNKIKENSFKTSFRVELVRLPNTA